MARFRFACSFGFLAGVLSIIVLEEHVFSWPSRIFLDATFMKDRPMLTLAYRPFGYV
ncbi:hypothetical protein BDR03DRAFT_964545 [Suillus americanus]|nr:hypothetical protein BDR03DRAFT_964545 [Suillus americanus]